MHSAIVCIHTPLRLMHFEIRTSLEQRSPSSSSAVMVVGLVIQDEQSAVFVRVACGVCPKSELQSTAGAGLNSEEANPIAGSWIAYSKCDCTLSR